MSKFIDRLKQLSRAEPEPMGFGVRRTAQTRLKIQLIASVSREDTAELAGKLAAADAGLLRLAKSNSGAATLKKLSQDAPEIPWGLSLQGSESDVSKLVKAGCDFLVFPTASKVSDILDNAEVGKILQVQASIDEGLLRAANDIPVDAVLVTEDGAASLTWQDLMIFKHLAALLSKPLLVSVSANITESELKALWDADIDGVVVEVTAQTQDRIKELREVIDKLPFPVRRREKAEIRLSFAGAGAGAEEEEEEDDDDDEGD